MKLAFKFFCVAYIVVLLAAGIPSAVFIQNSAKTEWSSREESVASAENYAVTSFLTLSELTSGKLSKNRLSDIASQIEGNLSTNISEFGILDENFAKKYPNLKVNGGVTSYSEENGRLIMESACKVLRDSEEYLIFVRSDFTELKAKHTRLWYYYSVAVFAVAVIGGVLLFFIAKKITDPLKKLTQAANDIADGNYGKTVYIKTSDIEIKELADSFNLMSQATENSLCEIKNEVEKRERFVANFTHEMKTPMTAIVGYAQLLNGYELSVQEEREAAEAIYKEGRRLESLSAQLLELFVTGNEEAELCATELSAVAERLLDTMKFSAEKYNCRMSVELPCVRVMANEPLLMSLLYNLVDNGFKACEGKCEVSVKGEITENFVKITVRDNGRGISSDHIDRLTEPFYREDKARSRRQGGAGIGLSLCKEIAAIHGTGLVFQSEQGKGTAVSFRLVLEVAE